MYFIVSIRTWLFNWNLNNFYENGLFGNESILIGLKSTCISLFFFYTNQRFGFFTDPVVTADLNANI